MNKPLSILALVRREAMHRMTHTVAEVAAVVLAAAALTASPLLLNANRQAVDDLLTEKHAALEAQMKELRNDMRLATLELSFNLYIFPEGTSLDAWYLNDTPNAYMPQDYVQRLATSGIVTVRHFLPSLQERVMWEEAGRSIILIGTMGEVPNLFKSEVKPLVQPVPKGTVVLGAELHRAMGVVPGDIVRLNGRTFTVHECYAERGNKDDVTAWIHLETAQEMLKRPRQLSAILALGCMCAGPGGIDRIRGDVQDILPNTQVVEMGTKALARFETRSQAGREAAAALKADEAAYQNMLHEQAGLLAAMVPVVILFSMTWIGMTAYFNARRRRLEAATLRAIGFKRQRLIRLLLGRALPAALMGLPVGVAVGFGAAVLMLNAGGLVERPVQMIMVTWHPAELLQTVLIVLLIVPIASWLPVWAAAGRSPAEILQRGE